eukprot:CAMPEP_0195625116 /NCGR_PEP_ID=MMETSP0815-20121206/17669_1 /TAXON_ID=97485 /ORGANISM="Prymnesium parvum, Strain Texoma1" /LENGTH=49 /DNA_ID= /DNA_START= /DNA_END= /DNA_ORIENTATION=
MMSAFFSSSSLTTPSCPLSAAKWRGERPSFSLALMSALLSAFFSSSSLT